MGAGTEARGRNREGGKSMRQERARGFGFRRRVSRRGLLRGAAAGVVGLGLAGCTATTETPTVAPAATAAATAAPTRAAGAAPAATPQAKRGGTLKVMGTPVEQTLDP